MPVQFNVGWDTETHLIAEYSIIPRKVCSSFDFAPTGTFDPGRSWVLSNADYSMCESLLTMWQKAYEGVYRIIIHNAAFDVTVLLRYCQDVINGQQQGDVKKAKELYDLIWDVLNKSLDNEFNKTGEVLVSDTLIREKLHNLSTYGTLETAGAREARYSLADLVYQYFKIDIKGKKTTLGPNGSILDADGNDITGTEAAASIWRLRYSELDSVPIDQWPLDAIQYAIDDSVWARLVWERQESNRQSDFIGSMNSEALQVYSDVALRLCTAVGFDIDQSQVERLEGYITAELGRIEPVLMNNGVLRPEGTLNKKVLQGRIENAWAFIGLPVQYTEKGQVATGKAVLEEIIGIDPVVDLFSERTGLAKLKTAYLHNFQSNKTWAHYDILKETGRTSSYGNSDKSRRAPLYPAINIQQMPRREGVRECMVAPEGYVLESSDYGFLELCSVAQVTHSLFGQSVHRDKINQGYDLHSFLGSSMASHLDPELVSDVTSSRDVVYALRDRDEAYHNFMNNREVAKGIDYNDKSEEALRLLGIADRCKHFRNLSKPIGLGYPGGLGPRTCAVMAKVVYGVDMTEPQAKEFRDLWHNTYPEMRLYFNWVNEQGVPNSKQNYAYVTEGFNRFRNNATYCATSNGKAMQSLSADGAKRSVAYLARACCGGYAADNIYSYLGDCQHMAFIHDENIVAIPNDNFATERAYLVSALMIDSMNYHMPDVTVGAEPALMTRWTKSAELETQTVAGRAQFIEDSIGHTEYAKLVHKLSPLGYDPNKAIVPWDIANPKKAAHALQFGDAA